MILKKFFLLTLLFTLIFKPEFIFIPHSVNMFFGFLGFLLYMSKTEDRLYILNISGANLIFVIKCFTPFVIVALFSIFLNGTSDFYYPRYALSLILYFFAAYLLAYFFYNIYGYMSVERTIDYLIIAECIFLFIGLLSFFNPEIHSLLADIQKHNEIALDSIERTKESRLISIGAKFFTAAVINGFVLILIGLQFYCSQLTTNKKILYIIAFIYILVVGMMMGRTTSVGGIIGFSLIVLSFTQTFDSSIKTIAATAASLLIAYIVYAKLILSISWKFDVLYDFGFEMFNNYQSGDGLSVRSNEGLLDMYNIIPDHLGTWLIGDAKWEDGNHYYMRVDPGYLRGLWYFGLIGLTTLIWYFYKFIHHIIIERKLFNGKIIVPFLAFFIYVLFLNSKGPADLFFCLTPFIFCNKFKNGEQQIVININRNIDKTTFLY